MKRIATTLFLPLLTALSVCAQVPAGRPETAPKTKTQRYVEQVAGNDILKGAAFGVLAVKKGGATLAVRSSGQRMLPASTLKLITTGAALHRLGPDFRYETKLGYKGTVKDGVLDGDLYLIGGGDPTIASKDSMAMPRFYLFSQWKDFLDKAGIKQVKGRVIGDGRYFDGPIEKDKWSYQDIGTAYGTGGDGLSFYENALDIKVSPGASVGTPVHALVSFPNLPWLNLAYHALTAKAGTGDELYLYTSDVYPFAEMRGSFAIDRKAKTEEFSNKFGAYTCAHYFCNYLKSKGIEVTGGPADVRWGRIRVNLSDLTPGPFAARVDDLTLLGSTASPTLLDIARATNYKSDNFYAETLLRTLGRKFRHSASYDSSYVALNDVFRSLGVDASDVQIQDGSGLARHDYVSPDFFVRFLSAMMESPVFGEYVGTLGRPGGRHYESRLRNEPASVKARIHYKSGSMNGVRCFAGYIEPTTGDKEDTIVFALMANQVLAKTSQVDAILDRIVALLASEN